MKTMMNVSLLSVGLLMLAACRKDDVVLGTPLTDNTLANGRDKMVHAIVSDYMKKPGTAGLSLALIDRNTAGDAMIFYNYGSTVPGKEQLPDKHTVYEIGSVTKLLTSMAIFKYGYETYGTSASHFFQDNPAGYLPGIPAKAFVRDGSTTKIVQLLNHTSGLSRLPGDFEAVPGYDPFNPYKSYHTEKVLAYISATPLSYKPGQAPTLNNIDRRYSNLAYAVAGIILSAQKNKKLQEIFEEYGFNTWFVPAGVDDLPSGFARPFSATGTGVPAWMPMGGFEGAGGLLSSAFKLSAMIDNYITLGTAEEALLPATTIQAMKAAVNPDYADLNPSDKPGVNGLGYGWEFYKLDNGSDIIVKDGGTGGSTAFVAFSKSLKKGIVMLTNNASQNGQGDIFLKLCNKWFE